MNTILRFKMWTLAALGALALTGCNVDPGVSEDGQDPELASTAQGLVHGEVVRLRAAHSLRCAEVSGGSPYDGATIQQWDCWGGNNQKFQAWIQPDGTWVLVAFHSGKCMTIGGTWDGAPIYQMPCTGGADQRFWINYSSGSYVLVGQQSGKCVDVAGYNLGNGALIGLWSCNYNLNQRFYLETQ